MHQRRSGPESVKSVAPVGPDAVAGRSRLVAALRAADLEVSAAWVARTDGAEAAGEGLDATRNVLMARLLRHSNDFPATTALKALDTFTAEVRADAPSGAPDRLRRQGQAGTATARRWFHLGGAA